MITVGISGAAGRMGSLVAETVDAADDLQLKGLYAPGRRSIEVGGVTSSTEPAALDDCEVVVEVTTPDVVMGNLAQWREKGCHVVVGTSGFTAERLVEVHSLWGAGPPNCLVVPNFSISAVLMMYFSKLAASHFDAVEIVEMHHEDKPDAPSGTSLATAEMIAAVRGSDAHNRGTEIVRGTLGGTVEGVPIHSIRLPGLVAHQEVLFGAEGQTLSLRSDATSWTSFMPGVLLAVRNVAEMEGVSVGIESLLGL